MESCTQLTDNLKTKEDIFKDLEEIRKNLLNIRQQMKDFLTADKHREFSGEFLNHLFSNVQSMSELAIICYNESENKFNSNNISELSVTELREFKLKYLTLEEQFKMSYEKIRKEVSNMDQADYKSVDKNIVS